MNCVTLNPDTVCFTISFVFTEFKQLIKKIMSHLIHNENNHQLRVLDIIKTDV